MSKKQRLIIVFIATAILFCIILLINFINGKSNKIFRNGNNINEISISNIERKMLNINSYEATVTIKVVSNKNENEYKIKQKYVSPNLYKIEVISPDNIRGVVTCFDGRELKVLNSSLNLSKIYSDYNVIVDNDMLLNTFLKNYMESEDSTYEKTDEYIILKTEVFDSNKYAKNKKLYIDAKTNMPAKLEIEDVNQKVLVYISYNEVELNNLTKDKIFI